MRRETILKRDVQFEYRKDTWVLLCQWISGQERLSEHHRFATSLLEVMSRPLTLGEPVMKPITVSARHADVVVAAAIRLSKRLPESITPDEYREIVSHYVL